MKWLDHLQKKEHKKPVIVSKIIIITHFEGQVKSFGSRFYFKTNCRPWTLIRQSRDNRIMVLQWLLIFWEFFIQELLIRFRRIINFRDFSTHEKNEFSQIIYLSILIRILQKKASKNSSHDNHSREDDYWIFENSIQDVFFQGGRLFGRLEY